MGQTITLTNLPSAEVAAATLQGGQFYSFFYYLSNSASLSHLATVYISSVPSFSAHEGLRILHGSYLTSFLDLNGGPLEGDQTDGDTLILENDCSSVSSNTTFATENGAILRK